MNDDTARFDCARARRTLHRLLDGEGVSDVERRSHAGHVAVCADCRAASEDLGEIARALAGLAQPEMPPETLDAVWARTVRSGRGPAGSAGLWRIAASLLLTAVLAGMWGWERRTASPTDAELRRASAEVRLVLGLTGRALHRTEEIAVHAVLGSEVSGALERLPIDWPEREDAKRRRSQT